jgi:hypothetical protein
MSTTVSCLIISCSATKCLERGPAILVYCGRLFQVIKKQLPRLDVFILSAKHGLISAEQEIEKYDQRIEDKTWTDEDLTRQIVELGVNKNYIKIHLCMSEAYVLALLTPLLDVAQDWQFVFRIAKGQSIGYMQTELKEFCLKYQEGDIPSWHKLVSLE